MSVAQKIDGIQTLGPTGIVPTWNHGDPETKIQKVNKVWCLGKGVDCLRNCANGTAISSSIFHATTDSGCKWYLKLYPRGIIENIKNDYFALYLYLDSNSKYTTALAKFKFSIFCGLDSNTLSSVICLNSPVRKFKAGPSGWGFSNFVYPDSELSTYFKVMIYCEISYSASVLEGYEIAKLRICNDLRRLFETGNLADVVLSVNGKEFKAHKTLLVARSPVFAAMFQHEDMEENQENKVNIVDFDEQVVEEMLHYIYTGTNKSENLEKVADSLLVAADKYGLDELKEKCERVLVENLSVDNATDKLIFADLYRTSKLKSNTIDFIVRRYEEVMKTPAWENIATTHAHLVIEVCNAFSRLVNSLKK